MTGYSLWFIFYLLCSVLKGDRGALRSKNLLSYQNELEYFCESSSSRVGELSAVLDSISLLISQQRADCATE